MKCFQFQLRAYVQGPDVPLPDAAMDETVGPFAWRHIPLAVRGSTVYKSFALGGAWQEMLI